MTIKFKKLPPRRLLKRLLDYNPENGKLYWKARSINLFLHCKFPRNKQRIWNSRYAGKEAFTKNLNGSKCGRIFKEAYFSHRIIWVICHGKSPKLEIDHINGNSNDNRITNLRDVSHSINLRNQRLHKKNTSGVSGVQWSKSTNKWSAGVIVDNKTFNFGLFTNKDEAAAVVKEFRRKNVFTERHGTRQ